MKNLIETKYRACERMDEREMAICSWATEDGIIIDRETLKSPRYRISAVSPRDAIFLAVEGSRCPYKETRWNWRKIDAKGVGPDEESKRERALLLRGEND